MARIIALNLGSFALACMCFAAEKGSGSGGSTSKARATSEPTPATATAADAVNPSDTGSDAAKSIDQPAGATAETEKVGAAGGEADTSVRGDRTDAQDNTERAEVSRMMRELAARENALSEREKSHSEEVSQFEAQRTEFVASQEAAARYAREQKGENGGGSDGDTGAAQAVGVGDGKRVEDATVQIVNRSYIREAMREPGEVVKNYTGEVGHNLRVGSVEVRDGVEVFVPDESA